MSSFILRLALAAVALALCACSTIEGPTQRMKIASNPEGAKIIFEGRVIGTTPAFVNIRRHHHAEIELERDGYPTFEKDLVGGYRVGDSLLSNFVWLIDGMPIASAIDLITETCWAYDKIGVINLGTTLEPLKPTAPRVIAVAPPQADYELLSDELVPKIEKETEEKYRRSTIVPYEKSRETFEKHAYTFDSPTDEDNADKLYDDLKVTDVLETTVHRGESDVVVRGDLVDVFTDEKTPAFEETVPDTELQYAKPSFKNFMASYLSVVPNLFTFDFTTPSSNMDIQIGATQDTYAGISNRSDTLLAFVSSFGFRSTLPPHNVRTIRGVLRFVPALSFQYDRFDFSNTNANDADALAGYDFDWLTAYGGLGGEAGLDTHLGYFYLDVIPLFEMNWVTGSGNGTEASTTTAALEGMLEVGYQIFASSRVNLRLFVRSLSIPQDAFADLIPSLTGQSASVNSVIRSIAGLSVGYYFPEDRTFFKRVLF